MEQFHAYENRGNGKRVYPILINLQHPVANVLKHILVAPAIELASLAGGSPPAKICPIVEINDKSYVVMMHLMAGISVKEVGERVADLSPARLAFTGAMDFLVNGY